MYTLYNCQILSKSAIDLQVGSFSKVGWSSKTKLTCCQKLAGRQIVRSRQVTKSLHLISLLNNVFSLIKAIHFVHNNSLQNSNIPYIAITCLPLPTGLPCRPVYHALPTGLPCRPVYHALPTSLPCRPVYLADLSKNVPC